MQSYLASRSGVSIVSTCLTICLAVGVVGAASGCAHRQKPVVGPPGVADSLRRIELEGAQLLKLKADVKRPEQVSYFHRSKSASFENTELRHQKEETLVFTSQAETVKVDLEADRITQVVTIISKDGPANLRDFAMPELGEKLEVTADSRGRILKSGDYPENSIFFVPSISLPDFPVTVGDTWTMQASWLSLEEMVPYQLDMVSILKGFSQCGANRCAEIEISGEVILQGPLAQVMAFKSLWKGNLIFDMDAGTVLWSRVDSEEQFKSSNVSRQVDSCLESALTEPASLKLVKASPSCL